jgi:hypothetical protein
MTPTPLSSPATNTTASAMEKRQNPRYRIEASAILRVEGRPGPFLVTLLDVSVSGLRLSSPTAFPEGSKVVIKSLGAEVWGEIRYARLMEAADFHLGVEAEKVGGGGELDLVRLFRRSLR